MSKLNINRLRIVLAEKERTNRWLAEQLGVNEGTVSHWATNNKQPSVVMFLRIANVLKVDIRDLFEPTLPKKES